MIRKVETEEAPQAIGPYSQAVVAGDFLFASGQIPLDPKTGKVVEGGIEQQTIQVLNNLEAVLKAENLSFQQVVKMEVYLQEMGDFPLVNKLYAERFPHAVKPARQTMEVAKLPLGVLIEISCIAYRSNKNY